MPKRFELLVFDWDGTLMDSADVIVASVQGAFRDLGYAPPAAEAARHIIGLGLTEAIQALHPGLDSITHERLAERYRHHFIGRDQAIPLFDGVGDGIRALRDAGFTLAVATGKSRRGLDRVLRSSGLGTYFHASRCADECFSKPHPQMLLELLEETGVAPERALMIGDTAHDLQMARNANVAAIGVAYGAHPREALLEHAPLALFDDYGALQRWLENHA